MPADSSFYGFSNQRYATIELLSCGLVARRLAVFARFACTDVNALTLVHLNFDRLIATVAPNVKTYIVAALF